MYGGHSHFTYEELEAKVTRISLVLENVKVYPIMKTMVNRDQTTINWFFDTNWITTKFLTHSLTLVGQQRCFKAIFGCLQQHKIANSAIFVTSSMLGITNQGLIIIS